MKSFAFFMLLGCVLWSAGCVSHQKALVFEPVRPDPTSYSGKDSNGILIVFSAPEARAHFNGSPYNIYYSDYSVCMTNGSVLREGRNNTGTMVEGPAEVRLAPGSYNISARASGYGTVTVPVVISAHQVTTVHLDGSQISQK